MKQLFLFLSVFFLSISIGNSQTLTLNAPFHCYGSQKLDVSVSGTGACLNAVFSTCSWQGGGNTTACPRFWTHRFSLERKVGPSAFAVIDMVSIDGTTYRWDNLALGETYRVTVERAFCTSTPAYNVNGQNLGFVGTWQFVGTTNLEILGNPATPSAVLVDADGGSSSIAWDQDDPVLLDARASTGQDRYYISIKEQTGLQRWNSWGWMFTPDHTDIPITDLLDVWQTNHPTWQFDVGQVYRATFVASNACQSLWNPIYLDFTICPSGNGCKPNLEGEMAAEPEITVFPNPTSDWLNFEGLNSMGEYRAALHDMGGKILLDEQVNQGRINLSNLPNGLYMLRLHDMEDGNVTTHKVQVIQ